MEIVISAYYFSIILLLVCENVLTLLKVDLAKLRAVRGIVFELFQDEI